jgi:proteasome activator subunit 3 (PA28 gamma)
MALKEHDDHEFYLARQHLIDLRNIYAVLTDLIHKNIAKVRTSSKNSTRHHAYSVFADSCTEIWE